MDAGAAAPAAGGQARERTGTGGFMLGDAAQQRVEVGPGEVPRARQRGGVVAGLDLRRSLVSLREVGDEVVGDDDLAMHDGEVALCLGI